MTTKEKAREIIQASNANQVYDIVDFNALHEAQMEDLFEMSDWLIERAAAWLKENIHDYYTTGDGGDEFEEWFDDMFEDFRKAMKGE